MNNVYGTKRPANITSDDVDIFYSYRPSRAEDSAEYSTFKKLDSKLLMNTSGKTDGGNVEVLPGMFDLRLPLDIFGNLGIYTIYIKPKEIRTTILHISTLAAYPDVRGLVLDTNGMSNGSLVGYRVSYSSTVSSTQPLPFFGFINSAIFGSKQTFLAFFGLAISRSLIKTLML